MRDLILKMSISLDGFVADTNGGIQWVFGCDEEAKAWSVETVSTAGLHIMGSRTFRDMAAHWPTATDAFAAPMNRIPQAVFTRREGASAADLGASAARDGAESWAQAYVASGGLAQEIAALKAQEGNPIMAHGGAAFARALIAQGLVDQFTLLVCPVALGAGMPIFSGLAAHKRLELVSSRAFPGGAVAQVYRPV